MPRIKKFGIANLIINLVFTVLGGAFLALAWLTIMNSDFSSIDAPELGMYGILIAGIVGAAILLILFIPFVHMVLGGFNSLMMLLQILTKKPGFAVAAVLAGVLLVFLDGTIFLFGVSVALETGALSVLITAPMFALAIASLVLSIRSLEANKLDEREKAA